MDEIQEGEGVHGPAGKVEKNRHEQNIKAHHDGKEPVVYICRFSGYVAEKDVAGPFKPEDQEQNEEGQVALKEEIDCQNQKGLSQDRSPPEMKEPCKGYAGGLERCDACFTICWDFHTNQTGSLNGLMPR